MNWNTALRSLLLIRFGQELGTDSATARAVADAIARWHIASGLTTTCKYCLQLYFSG